MLLRSLLIGCLGLALASCCSCRDQIDPDELKSFTIGQTTMADVQTKIGVPTQISVTGGVTSWRYVFHYGDSNWVNGIPVIGVSQSYNERTQTNDFVFDSAGRLKTYTQSDAIDLAIPAQTVTSTP